MWSYHIRPRLMSFWSWNFHTWSYMTTYDHFFRIITVTNIKKFFFYKSEVCCEEKWLNDRFLLLGFPRIAFNSLRYQCLQCFIVAAISRIMKYWTSEVMRFLFNFENCLKRIVKDVAFKIRRLLEKFLQSSTSSSANVLLLSYP